MLYLTNVLMSDRVLICQNTCLDHERFLRTASWCRRAPSSSLQRNSPLTTAENCRSNHRRCRSLTDMRSKQKRFMIRKESFLYTIELFLMFNDQFSQVGLVTLFQDGSLVYNLIDPCAELSENLK
jgi:hypothetical protein